MTSLSLTNLQQYEQFDIRYPASIQPYGVLLVIDIETLTIIQVSENTREFLGVKPKTLLGKPLSYLMSAQQIQKIKNFLVQSNPEFVDIIKLKKKKDKRQFKGIVHTIQDSIILELEPLSFDDLDQVTNPYNLLKNAVTNISASHNLEKLLSTITEEVRKIIQFDRVLIYRFEYDNSGIVIAESKQKNYDGNGVVIAESKRENLESYLGLHYPAYDIPTPARDFFCSNWLRIIPDITYQPVPIIPRQHPLKNEELDLSRAVLRSVYPCHVKYLKNMGVSASMSISLMNENRLWGLIACHHYSPKYISYEIRKICEFLGQFLSVELLYKQEQEFSRYRTQIKRIQSRMREGLLKNPDLIDKVIRSNRSILLNLTRSQGAVVYLNKKIILLGKTPTKEQVETLISDFLNQNKIEIFYTDNLGKSYEKTQEFQDIGCGMLAISLFLANSTYHIIWFRPEQIHEVQWAGNPDDFEIKNNEQGMQELSPRHSFTMWKEMVKNKSLPWELVEIEAAQELRNTILLAALEVSQHSQAVLEEKTKQANAANLAKSQFLAKMSHELRTPLNAILGFTQMMNRDSSLSSDQQEYLGIINRSGEHLLSLINDVLEMSRIEAGQLTLHQTCFNLHELIKSVKELLTLKALSKGLIVTVHQNEDLPLYLEGDESKLRQIIVNLVGNAIKFTQVGQIDVHLSLSSYETHNREIELQLQVKDTGIGIKKEDLDTIFEAFKQTETAFETNEGTGLGLSISRQFARLMGGDITVDSQLGQGSTFTCKMKMMVPTKIEGFVKQQSKRIIGLQPSQANHRILVVEDVRDNQLLIVKILTSVGFDVRWANNGQEALEIWQKWHPQLIWMDMRMPIMNGYEASRSIRSLEAENPDLRNPVIIIALTATAFDEDKKAILEVGCNDFVAKPFSEVIIFDKMQQYLGVEYFYEDSMTYAYSHATGNQVKIERLHEEIRKMPKTWVDQLHHAASSAREKKLIGLIEKIPTQYHFLENYLRQMVKDLAFEKIVNLTQGFKDE
ncbi:MAG: ATP-binding protein [Crocosphaera sp.]|nr:ATP-binding protein [Crocosphaera sp.]